MSGQPDNKKAPDDFDLIMQALESIFEQDVPFRIFNDKFVKWFEDSGSLDWHEFYQMEDDQLSSEFLQEMESLLALESITDIESTQEAAQAIKDLNNLKESGVIPNPRAFEKKALTRCVRWMLISRVQKGNLTCHFQFGCTVKELIEKAESGDQTALLKLTTLDSTFLCEPFARRILNRVEIKNDVEFKKKLSTALKPKPGFWTLKGGRSNKRDMLALCVLHSLGYEDQSYAKWADFLLEHGFKNFGSAQTVAKAAKRCGLSKKYPSAKP